MIKLIENVTVLCPSQIAGERGELLIVPRMETVERIYALEDNYSITRTRESGLKVLIDGQGQFLEAHVDVWLKAFTAPAIPGLQKNFGRVLWLGGASGLLVPYLISLGLAKSGLTIDRTEEYVQAVRAAIIARRAERHRPSIFQGLTTYHERAQDAYGDAYELVQDSSFIIGPYSAIFCDLDPEEERFPALAAFLFRERLMPGSSLVCAAGHESWPVPEVFESGWDLSVDETGWRYASSTRLKV